MSPEAWIELRMCKRTCDFSACKTLGRFDYWEDERRLSSYSVWRRGENLLNISKKVPVG